MINLKASAANKKIFAKAKKFQKNIPRAIRRGLQQSGKEIAGLKGRANDGLIKRDMNKPKTGKTYIVRRGRKGRILAAARRHIASAPGQSPAVITGALRDSVNFLVTGSTRLKIGADTPYAAILEKGGRAGKNGSARIARRNYLRRPILQSRRDITRNIVNAIKEL